MKTIEGQALRLKNWQMPWSPLGMGVLVVGMLLGTPGPAQAGSSFKVGSFTKTIAVAPVSQVVAHGLGETPKALILWTNGKTDELIDSGFFFAFGVTDSPTAHRSAAAGSRDGADPSEASRRIATKALTIVQRAGVLLAEADLTAWDATNFTLNWTTNDIDPYVIHFIAIGGSDISAKVLGWTMPTSTGNKAVTGVGFKPDVVIHVHAGADFTTTPSATTTDANIGLGVMDASGDQWANAILSLDNISGDSNTQRGQQTDACLYDFDSALAVRKEAAWVSMDADGFTVNFSTANASAGQVVSLALKGLNVKASSFNKITSGSNQAVTGAEFQPAVVLLSSFQHTTQASPVAHARFGIGASDGTTEGSSAFLDADSTGDKTIVEGIDKTSKVFVKVNNNTPTIDAEADLTSLDSDGFTLNWTTNDGVATQLLYLAFGSLDATAVELHTFTATEYADGILLQWRTGWEVDNLGFHVYREAVGRRLRLTPALIAGSALMVGGGTELTAGRAYTWGDPDGLGTDRYWLEDVDLNGTRTWHGPVAVPQGALMEQRSVLTVQPSTFLKHLGWKLDPRSPLQRAVEAGTAVPLAVQRNGWQIFQYTDVVAAGMPPEVDPRCLQLFVDGREALVLIRGDADGSFDPGDTVEFSAWGQAARVYRLIEGVRGGKRIRSPRAHR